MKFSGLKLGALSKYTKRMYSGARHVAVAPVAASPKAITRIFVEIAIFVDRLLKVADWRLNCSYGGWLHRVLPRAHGSSLLSLLLLFVATFFLVGTPSLLAYSSAPSIFGVVISVFALAILLITFFPIKRLVLLQASLMLFLSLSILVLAVPQVGAITLPLYPNAYMVLCAVFSLLTLAVAWPLSVLLLRSLENDLAKEALRKTELPSRAKDDVVSELREAFSPWALLRALIAGPVQYNFRLLLLPALFVLLVRDPDYLGLAAALGLVLSWFVFALASLHSGIDNILELTLRAFFRGGQGVVSFFVILLAFGRIAGFAYVSSLLDSSPAVLIILYIVSLYIACWLYEYWINRLLSEEVLRILRGKDDQEFGRLSYQLGIGRNDDLGRDRTLQVHGGSRLVVVASGNPEAVEVIGRTELFERLAFASHLSNAERSELRALASEILRRIRFYFVFQSTVVLLCLGWLFSKTMGVEQSPAAHLSAGTEFAGNLALRDLIFNKNSGDPSRAILVSASGGGSRAALFAASILHGIWKADALDDLVMVSGVSGGAASLSYFSAHLPVLQRHGDESKWVEYEQVMSTPFIEEVIANVWDWRVLLNERLGFLLKESFDRHFFSDRGLVRTRLGEVKEIGVLLNAGIAGHEDLHSGSSGTRLAGGIFSFTNLAAPGFPRKGLTEIPGEFMRFIASGDPDIELAVAGAVSANFPPVFPNAAVDVVSKSAANATRYWLTDGGAVENRGLLALLYVLRDALAEEQSKRFLFADKQKGDSPEFKVPPNIDVLVGEASAENLAFYQDRGIGSSMKAPRKFISQLIVDLWRDIENRYVALGGDRANIRLYNLAMPLFLRSNGGLGTHWMVPRQIVVRSPAEDDSPGIVMTGKEARELISNLHDSARLEEKAADLKNNGSESLGKVWSWAVDDQHHRVWKSFTDSLRR